MTDGEMVAQPVEGAKQLSTTAGANPSNGSSSSSTRISLDSARPWPPSAARRPKAGRPACRAFRANGEIVEDLIKGPMMPFASLGTNAAEFQILAHAHPRKKPPALRHIADPLAGNRGGGQPDKLYGPQHDRARGGRMMPVIDLSSVDLPAPLRPRSATSSRRQYAKDAIMLSSASLSQAPRGFGNDQSGARALPVIFDHIGCRNMRTGGSGPRERCHEYPVGAMDGPYLN